jgi:hypothetical protein
MCQSSANTSSFMGLRGLAGYTEPLLTQTAGKGAGATRSGFYGFSNTFITSFSWA